MNPEELRKTGSESAIRPGYWLVSRRKLLAAADAWEEVQKDATAMAIERLDLLAQLAASEQARQRAEELCYSAIEAPKAWIAAALKEEK